MKRRRATRRRWRKSRPHKRKRRRTKKPPATEVAQKLPATANIIFRNLRPHAQQLHECLNSQIDFAWTLLPTWTSAFFHFLTPAAAYIRCKALRCLHEKSFWRRLPNPSKKLCPRESSQGKEFRTGSGCFQMCP